MTIKKFFLIVLIVFLSISCSKDLGYFDYNNFEKFSYLYILRPELRKTKYTKINQVRLSKYYIQEVKMSDNVKVYMNDNLLNKDTVLTNSLIKSLIKYPFANATQSNHDIFKNRFNNDSRDSAWLKKIDENSEHIIVIPKLTSIFKYKKVKHYNYSYIENYSAIELLFVYDSKIIFSEKSSIIIRVVDQNNPEDFKKLNITQDQLDFMIRDIMQENERVKN